MTAFLYTATEKILQFCTRLQHTFSLDGRSPSCKGLLVMDKLTWWTEKFGFSTRGRFSYKMYDQHSAWHGGDSHRLLYRILEPTYGYFRRNQWKSRRSTSMSSIGWSDDQRRFHGHFSQVWQWRQTKLLKSVLCVLFCLFSRLVRLDLWQSRECILSGAIKFVSVRPS